MRLRIPLAVLSVLAGVAAPAGLAAQAPGCTYDACALRLQFRGSGNRVVQGVGATRVSRGFLRPRIEVLATATDSARTHYEAYRRHAFTAHVVGGVGALAALTGTIWYAVDTDHRSAAQGVSISGAVLSLLAGLQSGRAAEHLQLSIWHYNRALPASVP